MCIKSGSVERCLWCTKAAATIGPSTIRTRILSSLWLLLVPGDENKILLSTHGFKSITSGLLILLAALSSSSTPVTQILHPDVQLLRDLVLQFLSGSLGDLEEDQMVEVYGIEYGIDDRRHTGALRRGVFLEGLVGCIENCLGTGTGVWILENLLEVPSFSPFFINEVDYITGLLVFALHGQVDTASSNYLQSETEHLLPLFFNAVATSFPVIFNYPLNSISYVLSFRFFALLLISYFVLAILFCHKL